MNTHSAALSRFLTASGAVLAALSVALSAYAVHGVEADAQHRLYIAALFAFGHGIALAALAPHLHRKLMMAALSTLLLGTLLFSGSLVVAVILGAPTALAPFGGLLMILAWLLYAAGTLRCR